MRQMALLLAGVFSASMYYRMAAQVPTGNISASAGYVGNELCRSCHKSIFESYETTAMAHASGPATEGLIPADFLHQPSNIHFRIYKEGDAAWLSFERPGDAMVRGKRQLLYFIGSGHRGRSYLFSVDGFLFESPVNWYARKQVWDMAPAYGNARQLPMNLPAFISCLNCHVSGAQAPVAGTENRYPSPPFSYSGVTCERCHGPGAAHLKGGPIVDPAKLPPKQRDEVCMQCHLEGKVAIVRQGRQLADFRPGQILSDYVEYYVLKTNQAEQLGALSQFEALGESVCKKQSGDSMSCTSCHDPHSSPTAEQRVSFYRGKCLVCHGAVFGAQHHAQNPDCTECHMPSSPSSDVAHTEVTDHRILRRPLIAPEMLQNLSSRSAKPELLAFDSSDEAAHDARDLALAWETLADSGNVGAQSEAERWLQLAAKQRPSDPAVLSTLGYLDQIRGDREQARALYQQALALDPTLLDAATNLGVLEAQSGHDNVALKLWQRAFERAPGRSNIGMNLAKVSCSAGKLEDARNAVLRVLEFNPDLPSAKTLLEHLNATPPSCSF